MQYELGVIFQFLADLMLPFMRISGMFAAMIGISAKTMPPPVRALLAAFLALIIMPVVDPVPIDNLVGLGTFMEIIRQLLIGVAMGFISMMVLR